MFESKLPKKLERKWLKLREEDIGMKPITPLARKMLSELPTPEGEEAFYAQGSYPQRVIAIIDKTHPDFTSIINNLNGLFHQLGLVDAPVVWTREKPSNRQILQLLVGLKLQ